MTTKTAPTTGEWLESWDPENEETWDKALAWRTLWVTTFCLTLAFVAWFLPSAIIPKLNPLGYEFSKSQLYWMAAMPGLAAGLMRLIWMVLPPIMGTRKMVSLTTLLLIASTLGWGVRVQEPDGPLLGAHGRSPSWPASVAARSPASCRARRTSSRGACRAPRSACRPASATSASRSSSCSPRTSSA